MKLSIRLKLLIGFTMLLFLASFVEGLVYVITKNYVSNQISNMQTTEVNRGAAAIQNFFSELLTNSQVLAQVYQKKPNSFTDSATYLINSDDYIRRVTVLSPPGKEIEKIDLFGKVAQEKLSYEVENETFKEATLGRIAFSKVYYSQKEIAPHMDMYTPIQGSSASTAGILKLKVNLHQVQEDLSRIRVGESGFIYVVDDEGRLIAHASEKYVLERPNLASRAIIANALANKQFTTDDEHYVNENNIPVVAKAVKIPGLNWIAVLEQPRAEAYGFLTVLGNLFIITFAGSMLFLLLVAFILSENLTRPIRKLQRSAQQIESGQSKKTVIINSGDEIESLSKSFASMTDMLMQRDQWLERTTLQLNEANEQLKKMDKLKSDFVSVASHELRTPMTAVKSYLSMALDGMGGQLNEKQRYYVSRAYQSSDRLILMVNDMLNISRIESGRLTLTVQKVTIEKIVQEVIDDVRPRASELGVNIIVHKDDTLPPAIADCEKIKEVLFNLIGNSLKFTQKDGIITITLKTNGPLVEVKIADTGAGIDAEDLPKLFQKFGLLPGSYTNQTAMGTGLGLYICKSIIEMHEGTIWAASDGRGKGTEFTFTLKVYTDEDFQRLSTKFKHDDKSSVELVHNQI